MPVSSGTIPLLHYRPQEREGAPRGFGFRVWLLFLPIVGEYLVPLPYLLQRGIAKRGPEV